MDVNRKKNLDDNLGALIDLRQIKDGKKIAYVIDNFNKLQSDVKSQIDVSFEKRFSELSKNYSNMEGILKGYLELLWNTPIGDSIITEIRDLRHDLEAEHEYTNAHFFRKVTDEVDPERKRDYISLDDMDEDVRKKIYWLLANAGDKSGYAADYWGNIRKVRWIVYFTSIGSNQILLKQLRNTSTDGSKYPSTEDWYGDHWEEGDFSNQQCELYCYDKPAEEYIPLTYSPVTGDFDSSIDYYELVEGHYLIWDKSKYNPSTWDVDKQNLYWIDTVSYEAEIIDLLSNETDIKYHKTYVFRNLGKKIDPPNPDEKDRKEPQCGRASYNSSSTGITFDHTPMTRYVYKLVEYEY